MTALQLFAYIAAATALQLLLGVAFAVWRAKRMVGAEAPGVPALLKDAAWTGLRDFRVTGRAFEDLAQTQSSFTLAPIDGQPLAPCKPGQFLTFSLPVAGEDAPGRVVRCYSISDTPAPDQYRITVKRALAPAGSPEVPAGLASAWLHDQAQIGTIVQVRAPAGQFVFTPEPGAPPVFIAGGIGITPILSMLKAALAQEPGRVAHLFYGVHNGQDHAFRAVLSRLAAAHPGLALHLHYSNPAMEDVQGRDYEHAGFLSLDYLKQTLPYGRHAFYLCGPDPMMQALIPALLDWGVDIADIHRESFGPQTAAPKPAGPATAGPVLAISFRRSGRTLDWTGQDTNLLDFAERNSIRVDSGCRSGSCGTCEIALISGRVTYGNKPDHDITPGHCLLCLGIPVTALELDA
jgi:ferredoxin-NADP reductase